MFKVTKMSSAKDLKRFVIQCLVAASEEIFGVFQRKIDEYEKEIDRQRRMLAVARQPVIKLHRTELLEQLINKEEEVLTDQQLCNQERNFSLDQEDPEPPQIKEEEEELCSSQDGEQLLLKKEIDTFILRPVLEENVHFEDQNMDLNPFDSLDRSIVNMPVSTSLVSVPNTDLQLLSNSFHVAEIKDQNEGKHNVCGSTEDTETKQENQHKNNCHRSKVRNSRKIRSHCDTDSGTKIFKCKMCGKYFKWSKSLTAHMKIHTDGKSFVCKTGGKYFSRGNTHKHIRIHADERPYSCTCGKSFKYCCQLISHMRMHTGEKPYACDTCGKGFSHMGNLSRHMRIHTGERPFVCTTCGNAFNQSSHLLNHMKSHRHKKTHNVFKRRELSDTSVYLVQMRRAHTDSTALM